MRFVHSFGIVFVQQRSFSLSTLVTPYVTSSMPKRIVSPRFVLGSFVLSGPLAETSAFVDDVHVLCALLARICVFTLRRIVFLSNGRHAAHDSSLSTAAM